MAAKTTGKIGAFFKGVRAELKRVNWPNREKVLSYTSVVIIVCAMVAASIWVFDSVFQMALKSLLGL